MKAGSKLDLHCSEIEGLLADGSSQNFIARHYHVSGASVRKWRKEHGLELVPNDLNIIDKFWSNTRAIGRYCIEWIGSITPGGYGQFQPSRKLRWQAHRFAWEITFGPIPEGTWVLHQCDNRWCVNPYHLFLGDHQKNMEDRSRKGRQPRGETHGAVKLTEDQVRKIRAMSGFSQREIGEMFGVSQTHVSDIRSHDRWRHI